MAHVCRCCCFFLTCVLCLIASDIVYFEKLEISILELENKLPKEVTWMNALQREEAVFQLLLQKNDTVQAILDAVRPKISLRGEPKKPKVVVAAATVAPAIIADPAGPTPMTGVVPAPAATPTLDAAANEPTPMAGVAPAQPTTTEEKGSGILRAYEVKDGKILQVLDPKTPVKDVAHAVVVEVPIIPERERERATFKNLLSTCRKSRSTSSIPKTRLSRWPTSNGMCTTSTAFHSITA